MFLGGMLPDPLVGELASFTFAGPMFISTPDGASCCKCLDISYIISVLASSNGFSTAVYVKH